MALMVPQVQLAPKALKVFKAMLVRLVQQVRRAQLASMVLMVQLDRLVRRELQVSTVLTAQQVQLALPVHKALKVMLVRWGRKVLRAGNRYLYGTGRLSKETRLHEVARVFRRCGAEADEGRQQLAVERAQIGRAHV